MNKQLNYVTQKNKHILWMLILTCGIFLRIATDVQAVSGVCSDCHVMHASDLRDFYGNGDPAGTAYDNLLVDDCLGCHSGENTGASIADTAQAPYVFDTGILTGDFMSYVDGTSLAGGDFRYSNDNVTLGHNPNELSTQDTILPAGWKTGFTDAGGNQPKAGAAFIADELSCAGLTGCHGDHTSNGITGAHHADDGNQTRYGAATVGTSYRFLFGTKGFEDADWEYETTTTHNIYYGADRSGGNEAAVDAVPSSQDQGTISYFCAECHGIFHSGSTEEGLLSNGDAAGSPWIRHPIDTEMPIGTTEYASYNAYHTDAPVASSETTGTYTDFDVTDADGSDRIVMCLSCHVAHASPYRAALRWPYTMDSGAGSSTAGCFRCHTAKDGVAGN